MMTSVLDTQAATAAQTVTDIPVFSTVTQPTNNQEMAEQKSFKSLKVKVSSPTTPTINLDDSDSKEDVIDSTPVTEEVDQHLQLFIDLFNSDGKTGFIHVSIVSQSSSVSSSSSSTLLLSSIQTLSTFPAGEPISPALSQLYRDLTSTSIFVTSPIVQTSMSLPAISEAPIFKILLHLPSVTLSISTFHLSNLQPHSSLQSLK